MQNKVEESNKWSRSDKLQVLSLIVAFLYLLLQYLPFLTKIITGLSLQLETPLLTTRLLIVLTLFVVLTLYSSLSCVIKINKHNNSPQLIDSNPKKPEPEFVPSKEMIEIMLLLQNGNKLYEHEIQSKLSHNKDKISFFIGELFHNDYIEHYLSDDIHYVFAVDNYGYKLMLSHKGKKFLIDNGLI